MRKQQKQPEKTFVLCPKPITPVVCLKMSRTKGHELRVGVLALDLL